MSKTPERKGVFITFEGGEGAGKTTQIRRLERALRDAGHNVVLTREPGGTPEAEKIRELLVQRDGGDWAPVEECLLLFAARSSHIRQVIAPALEAGRIVICDRFTDSTMAYQGYGRGLPREMIEAIDSAVTGKFKPDMTIILDIPAAEGLARSKARLASDASTEDRFEQAAIDFHERLRQGFLEIASAEPDRCHVLDARGLEDKIAHEIHDLVAGAIKGALG